MTSTAKALNGGCLLNPQSKLLPTANASIPSRGKLWLVIDGIKVIANSDLQDLSFGASFAELGDNLFEEGDYFMAAQHYELAISFAEFE